MNVLAEKVVYRPDDLLAMSDGPRYELVNGRLKERHMGSISSWIGSELYALLRDYAKANRFGWAFHADTGFDCFPRGNVRYPDVAAVRFGRLPNEELPQGHMKLAPDFAAEVVSPNDRAGELEEKLHDYRAAGVGLVWVIYPDTRTARAHRPDRTTTEFSEDDVMPGEAVLPGFAVRLGDLFPPPRPTAATGGSP
ncbi:MAG TPA: Uma2 family endonuclease [Urbifossiella sp.]|nr:Uma2 family endonuclease [Urbifossiella sp.]